MHFYYLSTYRMAELQVFGMEVEAVGRLTVERIAHNGAVHAVGVGGMDTELVGAAGFGVVVDESAPFIRGSHNLITGDGGFAVLEIDELVGAVVEVRTEGEADEVLGLLALRNAF